MGMITTLQRYAGSDFVEKVISYRSVYVLNTSKFESTQLSLAYCNTSHGIWEGCSGNIVEFFHRRFWLF